MSQPNPAEILLQAAQLIPGIENEDQAQREATAATMRRLADLIETDPSAIKSIAVLVVEKSMQDGTPGCVAHGSVIGSYESLAATFIQMTPLVNTCMQYAQPILAAEATVQKAMAPKLVLAKG